MPIFKLGAYYEDEGRDVADYLEDAGIKVDIKTFIDSWREIFHYLEGHQSELKGDVKGLDRLEKHQ